MNIITNFAIVFPLKKVVKFAVADSWLTLYLKRNFKDQRLLHFSTNVMFLVLSVILILTSTH